MSDDDLVSIIAHGIADAQGDAYAEYASEFDGYARAAIDALKKNLAGFSSNGINVWGSPDDIKAVANWQHSHVTIVSLRSDLRHWREECGKVHAKKDILVHVSRRVVETWEFPDWEMGDDSAYEHEFIMRVQALTEEMRNGGYME